jgi:sugar lactone lactonase YvrE
VKTRLGFALALSCLVILTGLGVGTAGAQNMTFGTPTATRLVSGLEGGAGGTVGSDGALYVAEGAAGRVSRVDPRTGQVTTFATGLPRRLSGFTWGGPVDVAFIGDTAYVLVNLVGTDVGGHDVVGIYRVDGPNRVTVIADIGAWSFAHPPPPNPSFFLPHGGPFGLRAFHDGFLVTDGNHNRVLRVTREGQISQLIQFDDIVPTGLAVRDNTIYMGEAGPVPHRPQDGRVVAFDATSPIARAVASGAPILVDVAVGGDGQLYALSNGTFSGGPEGTPGLPNTGALVKANDDGTLTVVKGGLNQPISLQFIGNTAYVVTLSGEVWKIEGVSGPPVVEAGTVTGSLAPGQVAWYQYYHDAKANDAVTLKTSPAVPLSQSSDDTGYGGGAFFNVEWTGLSSDSNFPGGMYNQDATGYWRVGQSTRAGLDDGRGLLPANTQYWQQGASANSATYEVEVVNASSSPIAYALTLNQSKNAISASTDALPAPEAPASVAAPGSPVISAAPAP